jgi:hypothetical protein
VTSGDSAASAATVNAIDVLIRLLDYIAVPSALAWTANHWEQSCSVRNTKIGFFVTKKSPAFAVVLAIARLIKAVRRCDNDRVLVFTDDHYQKSVVVSMLTRSAAQVLAGRPGSVALLLSGLFAFT